ncbi:MAG: tol-pal system protein YbgF [Thermodesulfobacteriota bacterium]|nr:MAG: tol-pal system protein YbgF [Thermodesulfobacteriota bacterium]
MKRHSAFIALLFLAMAIPACGPGFPIMTGEQEKFMNDVDRLVKDNEELKRKVAVLEGSGGLSSLRTEVDGLKRSLAESNIGLDKLRQDMAFVRGAVEEGTHEKEEILDAVRAADTNSADLVSRLAAIESSVRSVQDGLASMEVSQQYNDSRFSELKDEVAALNKQALMLEQAVAGARTEAAGLKEGAEGPGGAEDLYNKGFRETTAKDYSSAIQSFQKFLSAHPEHKLAGNAQYWLGEIYYAKGDMEMAILEFDKALKKYPGSEKTPASLLKQAFAFEKLGAKKEARVLLQEVIQKYPKSGEAGLARKRLDALK